MPGKSDWKGHLAAQKVELHAAEKGIVCSTPSIPCRYDRILDVEGELHKVQIKYAGGKVSHAEGVVVAKLGQATRKGNYQTYAPGEVDALIVYISPTNKLVWLPEDVFVGKKVIHIRYKPAKNNQSKGCLMADDYEW